MREVDVQPLPAWARALGKFRPQHPPIFQGYTPTDDEIELARALFAELDPESRAWYGGARVFADLRGDHSHILNDQAATGPSHS